MITVIAHAGELVGPSDLASSWPLDPATILFMVGVSVLYARGIRRLWRGEAGRSAVQRWRVGAFAGALLLGAAIYLTPLEPWADTLFGVHMGQHLVLTLLIAPLVVLARPVLVMGMALSPRARRIVWRLRPDADLLRGRNTAALAVAAVVLHAVTMWVWHVPSLYELALSNLTVHMVEHVTMLAGALPLWFLVLDARDRHATAISVMAVFVTVLQSGALAGLFTFATAPMITAHGTGPSLWGLTALEDQQLAGGLMWFPGGLLYVVAGAWGFYRWLQLDEEQSARAAEDSDARIPS